MLKGDLIIKDEAAASEGLVAKALPRVRKGCLGIGLGVVSLS